jgi:hypothetical protein
VVLVDANALLDILTADPVWSAWSQGAMMEAAPEGLAINPIIYSELAPAFREERELAAPAIESRSRYRTYFPKVSLICPTEDSPAVF